MSIRTWIEEQALWLKTGARIKIANDGRDTEQIVIRYKDFFLQIDFDAESGNPTGGFGWTHGAPITHVPVREFYTAQLNNFTGGSDPFLYRLSGALHEGVETSEWRPTSIDRGNNYPWETKLNPDYTTPTQAGEL